MDISVSGFAILQRRARCANGISGFILTETAACCARAMDIMRHVLRAIIRIKIEQSSTRRDIGITLPAALFNSLHDKAICFGLLIAIMSRFLFYTYPAEIYLRHQLTRSPTIQQNEKAVVAAECLSTLKRALARNVSARATFYDRRNVENSC